MTSHSWIVGVILLAAGPLAAEPEVRYRLSVLVVEGDTIDGKRLTHVRQLSLNDEDVVAFVGFFDGGRGIFTQHGLVVAPGDTISGKTLTWVGTTPMINNAGTIVFSGRYAGGNGYFTQHEKIAVLGETLGGKTLTGFGYSTAINESGTVAFYAQFDGGDGIFTQDGPVVVTGDSIARQAVKSIWRIPDINDAGDVALSAQLRSRSGGYSQNGLRIHDGMMIEDRMVTSVGLSDINNAGEISTVVMFGNRDSAVVTQRRIIVATGDVVDGKTITNVSSSTNLNDAGELAFYAYFDGGPGGESLFAVDALIAAEGQTVDGKTIAKLGGGQRINNKGNVAFAAEFQDGSSAIVLAVKEVSQDESSADIARERAPRLLLIGLSLAVGFCVVLWFVVRTRRSRAFPS